MKHVKDESQVKQTSRSKYFLWKSHHPPRRPCSSGSRATWRLLTHQMGQLGRQILWKIPQIQHSTLLRHQWVRTTYPASQQSCSWKLSTTFPYDACSTWPIPQPPSNTSSKRIPSESAVTQSNRPTPWNWACAIENGEWMACLDYKRFQLLCRQRQFDSTLAAN